jgi:hypothetical protein
VGTRGLSKQRAEALVARLEIGLDCGVCLACVSIVSWTVRTGTAAQIRGQLCSMTPDLWHDGLAEVALSAVRDAAEQNVPDAEAALVELEARGGRSGVARAIVRRLALELARREKVEIRAIELTRYRLAQARPEWN